MTTKKQTQSKREEKTLTLEEILDFTRKIKTWEVFPKKEKSDFKCAEFDDYHGSTSGWSYRRISRTISGQYNNIFTTLSYTQEKGYDNKRGNYLIDDNCSVKIKENGRIMYNHLYPNESDDSKLLARFIDSVYDSHLTEQRRRKEREVVKKEKKEKRDIEALKDKLLKS